MVGIWQSYADVYLCVVGVVTLVGFGLPLLLVPLRWAKIMGWEIPQQQDLLISFGRTLGLFTTLIAFFAIRVTAVPAAKPFFFDLMLWLFAGMIILHIYGAIKKVQPKTETVEIGLWVFLFLITLCFYPA